MNDPFLQALPDSVALPTAVRFLHTQTGTYSGRCRIDRGSGHLIALALRLGRFPPSADNVPVRLIIDRNGQSWSWGRDFGGHETRSALDYDLKTGCVRERIGGLTIWLKPVLNEGALIIDIHRLSVLGVPCPKFLLPRSSTSEAQDDHGRFRFDVSAAVPGLGMLIRYQGWLTPVHVNPPSA